MFDFGIMKWTLRRYTRSFLKTALIGLIIGLLILALTAAVGGRFQITENSMTFAPQQQELLQITVDDTAIAGQNADIARQVDDLSPLQTLMLFPAIGFGLVIAFLGLHFSQAHALQYEILPASLGMNKTRRSLTITTLPVTVVYMLLAGVLLYLAIWAELRIRYGLLGLDLVPMDLFHWYVARTLIAGSLSIALFLQLVFALSYRFGWRFWLVAVILYVAPPYLLYHLPVTPLLQDLAELAPVRWYFGLADVWKSLLHALLWLVLTAAMMLRANPRSQKAS